MDWSDYRGMSDHRGTGVTTKARVTTEGPLRDWSDHRGTGVTTEGLE